MKMSYNTTVLLLSVWLAGCAVAHTKDETVFVLGQTKYESCVAKSEQAQLECTTIESKGLSAEFVAFVSLAFGWIPWPF